jgi:colanic acid/amylovoran biosynthesis glycosyltransferase
MRIAYLIGQYPAINHGYLLREVQQLRQFGVEVSVASVNGPDRPPEKLSPEEKEAAAAAFCVKAAPPLRIIGAHCSTLFTRPASYFRGLWIALRTGGPRWLLYFAEAIVVGRWMRSQQLRHLHVSFSGHVGMLTREVFPIRASLAVYGYGELAAQDSRTFARIVSSMTFVRCISRHSRSMVMLACAPSLWDRIVASPLGIGTEAIEPAPFREHPRPFTLTYVGRLAPEKGQGLLLEAVAKLRSAGSDVRVQLVGDGPDRAALEHQAARDSIQSAVVFEGYVSGERLAACYQETDAFVLTSLYEGIPMVLMEAMAMQIACVAPRITGIPELIEDGISGLLFHPADGEDLVRKLTRLMRDPAQRRTLGENGRKRVSEMYDSRRNTEAFARVLHEQVSSDYDGTK